MGILGFGEISATDRIAAIKSLSEKLNAKYYFGINMIRNKFIHSSDINNDMNNSNVIVGEKDGYEYCFIEYFRHKTRRTRRGKTYHTQDESYWVSKAFLRLNNEILPDFTITTKEEIKRRLTTCFSLGIVGEVISLGVLLSLLSSEPKFGFFLFLFFQIPTTLIMIMGFISFQNMNNQKIYNIHNSKFKEKYIISTKAEPQRIREIFNDNVCNNILKYLPEIKELEIRNNCLTTECGFDGQLSFSLCNSCLNQLVDQAKLFNAK